MTISVVFTFNGTGFDMVAASTPSLNSSCHPLQQVLLQIKVLRLGEKIFSAILSICKQLLLQQTFREFYTKHSFHTSFQPIGWDISPIHDLLLKNRQVANGFSMWIWSLRSICMNSLQVDMMKLVGLLSSMGRLKVRITKVETCRSLILLR